MDSLEPTLLVKATSLSLKYLLRLQCLRFVLLQAEPGWFSYGIEISDDPDHPALVWSAMERADERAAIEALMVSPKCAVFLFNEAVINVAWAEIQLDLSDSRARRIIGTSTFAPSDGSSETMMRKLFTDRDTGRAPESSIVKLELPPVREWLPITSKYISRRTNTSPISIFNEDEGGQQEELALWLTNSLHSNGAVRSPQIHEPKRPRELSDILLSYEYGTFLMESKTLSVMTRDVLPPRTKLTQDLIKHLQKATSQLAGGVKNIRRGYRVTDLSGEDVKVNSTHTPHVIVLVPDLSLLTRETSYGRDYFIRIMQEIQAFLHILDLTELVRMVQAAEMIVEDNPELTTIEAFDWYLMERAKVATQENTPHFSMLYRKPGQITVVTHRQAALSSHLA